MGRERIIDVIDRTIAHTQFPSIKKFGGLSGFNGLSIASGGLSATPGMWGAQRTWPTTQEIGATVTEINTRNVLSSGQSDPITDDDALRWGVDAGLYKSGYKNDYNAIEAKKFTGTIRYPQKTFVSDTGFSKLVQRCIAAARYVKNFGLKGNVKNPPDTLGWSVLEDRGWYPNEDKVREGIKQIIPGTKY